MHGIAMKFLENDTRASTSWTATSVIIAARGGVIMTSSLSKLLDSYNIKKILTYIAKIICLQFIINFDIQTEQLELI